MPRLSVSKSSQNFDPILVFELLKLTQNWAMVNGYAHLKALEKSDFCFQTRISLNEGTL